VEVKWYLASDSVATISDIRWLCMLKPKHSAIFKRAVRDIIRRDHDIAVREADFRRCFEEFQRERSEDERSKDERGDDAHNLSTGDINE
jgi:hypothetical protein